MRLLRRRENINYVNLLERLAKTYLMMINIYSSAQRLRDKSVKHGEGLLIGHVPDLQRLARTNTDNYSPADSS